MYKVLSLILFVTLFVGCSHKEQVSIVENYDQLETTIESASLQKSISPNKQQKYSSKSNNKNYITYQTPNQYQSTATGINDKLYDFYEEWKGVRYRLGGTSKDGIDCSGFIQKLLEEKMALNMPRTANEQSEIGKDINKQELNTGDLVFFKTGRNTRHVGIYLSDGKFLHASTKNGVMISSMDSEYYTKHYWKSKRIFD